MEPMQITAHLAGNIAISRPEDISLDGLLSYQVLRTHLGDEFYTQPDAKEHLLFARLPLQMRGLPSEHVQAMQTGDEWIDESVWYWACSRAQIRVQGHGTQYWNKRFDTQAALSDHIDFRGKVEKVLIEQGRYKAYHMPLPSLVCSHVTWYAYGDVDAITRYLTPITAIGKKRSQGNGFILRWEIMSVEEDQSEWCKDELMRALPLALALDREITPFQVQYIAYRAPQWHQRNQSMCVTSGKRP